MVLKTPAASLTEKDFAVELFATSPVLVALIVGGFGLLDLRMKHQFKNHEKYVAPIKEQVVNDHKTKNLRDQVDRLEDRLIDLSTTQETHAVHDAELMRQIKAQRKDLAQYAAWSEVENKRLWSAIEGGDESA